MFPSSSIATGSNLRQRNLTRKRYAVCVPSQFAWQRQQLVSQPMPALARVNGRVTPVSLPGGRTERFALLMKGSTRVDLSVERRALVRDRCPGDSCFPALGAYLPARRQVRTFSGQVRTEARPALRISDADGIDSHRLDVDAV